MKSLEHVHEALKHLAGLSGNEKVRKFGEYLDADPDFRKVVIYTLDPFKMYGIKSMPPCASPGMRPDKAMMAQKRDVFDILDELSAKKSATAMDKAALYASSCVDEGTWEVVRCITNNDLRCGIGAAAVKKFITDFPVHELAKCGLQICWSPAGADRPYQDLTDLPRFLKAVKNNPKRITAPLKLDGVRTWATAHESGLVTYTSRNGKPFNNFGKFDEQVFRNAKKLVQANVRMSFPVTFDGEVISSNKSFNKLMTQVSRINEVDPSTLSYGMFDLPFCGGSLRYRYDVLSMLQDTDDVWVVDHPTLGIDDPKDVEAFIHTMADKAWVDDEEGLVLKDWDAPYSFKRGNDWMKVVTTFSEDLYVIGFEEGEGKYAGVLGALIVDFKGKPVKVGSGYSDDERVEFFAKQPKMIEVLYRCVTEDGSLRFPRYRRVREDKE